MLEKMNDEMSYLAPHESIVTIPIILRSKAENKEINVEKENEY